MSGTRTRVFASQRIQTKVLIGIVLSLVVMGLLCTLVTFPSALAAPIVSDDFNDNSIDTAKWNPNDLFSGFTNTNVPIAETSQRLEIGPLLQNVSGSSYRGMRTVNTYNFSDAYSFVELVQAPATNTAGDAMFTVGVDVNNYYRIYESAGTLFGQRKVGGAKTTLFSTTYNTTNHRFLRIRHTPTGAVTLDTAPGTSGVPGTWTQQYTETWNSSIGRTATIFEVKGGTSQVEANAPGKVIFDNFEVASNTASAPTVTSISPSSGTTSGGTSVTITGTGFSSGATVSIGGSSATSVTVVSSTSITATTPAHTAGTVDVVVTNTDSQSGTLSNGYTYSAPETVLVSDDFNDNSLDTAKWDTNLFSGFTNTNVPLAETSQRLEIGPLLQNVSGSSYRGIRTVNSYTFTGGYAYVELVQAPASNTAADAMFTVGNSVTAYYRIYESAGNLIGLRNIGGTKTTLFSIPYDSTNHRFLRIRHTSTGAVTLDTAPGSGGVPGTWTQRYTETWNSSISTSGIIFEMKGGTFQVEANAPGKVIFDNFYAAVPGSEATEISNVNAASTCNTSALINFRTSAPSHGFIEYGTTTSYGSSTIDDPVRFYTEHAIQLTGLTANTTYHYRINATSGSLAQSGDLTFQTAASGASCPALPAEVDSRMPDMTGAAEYVVKANCTGVSNCFTSLQTALNTAGTDNGKRFVTVDAGLSFTGSITLPANADGNWIILRSSAHSNLAEGKRVFPADASNMFKLVANSQSIGALETAAGANHIRIIGMEVTLDPATVADAPGGAIVHSIINFTHNVGGSASNLPKFIGIDRSYVHGLQSKNNRRGIYWEGEDNFIIDSYFAEFHDVNSDGQAILAVTAKRIKVLNNTLISDGENFMWGGTGLSVSGYVVGGLEFARNHMFKPCSWKPDGGCGATYGGFDWPEKNLFELKTSAKALIFGNYFGGTTDSQGGFWADAQSMSLNLKLEQNSAGPTTCDLMEDILVYKNFVKNVHAGIAVVGRTVPAQSCTNIPERVVLLHNVLEADATTWNQEPGASSGDFNAMGFLLGGTNNLQVLHNSIVNATPTQVSTCNNVFTDGSLAVLGEPTTSKFSGFIFKDNFVDYRGCGISGSGNINNATGALDAHFTGWVFTNNGILRSAGIAGNFPTGQLWATSWSSQLVNFNSGLDGNYRVASGSTWKNAASDGKDLGADVDGVEAATANAPTGNWQSP